MAEEARLLRQRIERHEATVAIIGLGYVGLPLALRFAEAGFRVLGFDIDPAKVEQLDDGESYIQHIPATRVAEPRRRGALRRRPTTSRASASRTRSSSASRRRSTPHREPDLPYVERHGRRRSRSTLRRGPARRAREHDLSRHDRGGRAAAPRRARPPTSARTSSSPSRPSARTRATRDFHDANDPQGRRRHRRRPAASSPRRSTRAVDRARRARVVDARRRGGEDAREHLPRGEHRAGERAEDRLRPRWASTSGR